MSGAPYRDDLSAIVDFEQHLGIALALLDQLTQIRRRMILGQVSTDAIADVQREAHVAQAALWDQLAQARAIAVARGRAVVAYDRARASAGDITRRNAPTAPAVAAIAALHVAVPEAVVRTASPVDMDLQRPGWVLRYGWLIALFVLFTCIGLCSDR